MTSAQKAHAKQLKGPDAFQARLAGALNWILKNSRFGIYALVPIVLGMGGFLGWRYFEKQSRTALSEELGKIQLVYMASEQKASASRKVIQNQINELMTAASKDVKEEDRSKPMAETMAPEAKQKLDKLQAEAEAIKADNSEARDQLVAFFKKHEAKPEGWFAGMMAASLFIEIKNLDEAQKLFEAVIANAKDTGVYQMQARSSLMGLLLEKKDFDKALAEADALEKLVDKSQLPQVLLARGRIQMLKDAKADAKQTLANLIEKYGDSPEAKRARAMQAMLN